MTLLLHENAPYHLEKKLFIFYNFFMLRLQPNQLLHHGPLDPSPNPRETSVKTIPEPAMASLCCQMILHVPDLCQSCCSCVVLVHSSSAFAFSCSFCHFPDLAAALCFLSSLPALFRGLFFLFFGLIWLINSHLLTLTGAFQSPVFWVTAHLKLPIIKRAPKPELAQTFGNKISPKTHEITMSHFSQCFPF